MEFRYGQTIFFAILFNLTYNSEAYGFTKLYLQTSNSEYDRTAAVDLFYGNDQRVISVGSFHRRAPSWMYDRVLNATLPNNLL